MAIYDTYFITLSDSDNSRILINDLPNNLEYATTFNVNNELIAFTLMREPRKAFIYADRVYAFDDPNVWYFFNNKEFALQYNDNFEVLLAIKQPNQ